MSIPDKSDWPSTPDGTTDWEVLFEDLETGLIPLVTATKTPEELKQLANSIIRAVFKRKRDMSIITKVSTFLDTLVPEDADPRRFPTMQAGVKQMMRKVKDDRIKKAAEFVEKKKKQKQSNKKVNRRANPVIDFFRQSNLAKAVLVLSVAAMIPLGIFLGSPERTTGGGDVLEHIRWIDDYVFHHLPQKTWELQSVKKSKDTEIAISILITDPDHIDAINSMKRMARVALLNQVCPDEKSGIRNILDQGWNLWVVLKSPDDLLTGGTCHYED